MWDMTKKRAGAGIEWRNIKVKLGWLQPWGHNPRQSTKKQASRILESFNAFGQVQTVAVGPAFDVYDGHQRLSALLTLHGADYEIDARQSSRALTDDERRRLVIALHAGAQGAWDWDALGGWDETLLASAGMDAELLEQMNRDAIALREMLSASDAANASDADTEPQIDRAEELRQKWGVNVGDLWQLGEHRLICGDCTDAAVVARVMQGEKADMLTDPPYGMDLDTDWSDAVGSLGSIGAKHNTTGNKYSPVIGDDKQFDPSHLFDLFVTGEMFLFGADYYAEFLPQKNDGSWLVWDKRKESQEDAIGAEFELLWSKNKHKRRMLRHDWFGFLSSNNSKEARNRLHPTQKPTSLIEDILQQWCKAELIVDPYLGSGTTIIACENLGRRCRAVEIDPGYVAVALERWATHTGRTPVLIDTLDT